MKVWIAVLALLFAGCATGPAPRSAPARYDFGAIAGSGDAPVEVRAPAWIASDAMQYRRAEDSARRQAFAESRWVAPPAELLAAALRRQLPGSGTCRLQLELDEFVQSFAADGQSKALLALRANVRSARGESVAARTFSLEQPAGRDARAGVAAFAILQQRLAEELGEWAAQAAARCR